MKGMQWIGWIIVIIAILLLLPLVSVDIGVTSDWLIAIGVLASGIILAADKA